MNKTSWATKTPLTSKHFGNENDLRSSAPQFLFPYLKQGQRLLDCGCGTGIDTLDLADAIFPGRITGIDNNDVRHAEQLAFGREMVNADFRTVDIYRLPFEDEEFDVIYSRGLLETLEHPLTTLMELRRILRTGGILAISYAQQGQDLSGPKWSSTNNRQETHSKPKTFLNLWVKAVDLDILESAAWEDRLSPATLPPPSPYRSRPTSRAANQPILIHTHKPTGFRSRGYLVTRKSL